ncbi:hypothetical protein GcC1_120009 [Golovinomyces cichoracearum]|uniref:Uncharacterized protein n=1 Tax=Golovinomyces cichoracearum TaxID=62708 RepID=A0A420I739_9PEZI|nr:hypothetical protein GcC1_120009 [Golovinomyces cichoracearum]
MSNTESPEFMPWTPKDVSTSTSTQIARYVEERIQEHSIANELLKAQTISYARIPDKYLYEVYEKHRPINLSSKSTNILHPDSTRTRDKNISKCY